MEVKSHEHDHDYLSLSNTNSNVESTHDISYKQDTDSWQTVRHNKRNINSPPDHGLKRHRIAQGANDGQPSKDPLQLQNSYEVLSSNMDPLMDEDTLVHSPTTESKPPPIFLPGVTSVAPMVKALDEMVCKSDYTYKVLNQDRIKLFPSSPDAYRKIIKGLTSLNVSFHTYQLKQERAYRVVLKNMHYSTCIEDLKSAIEEKGHKVRNLTNVKNRVTKKPLSLFFVDLEPNVNNKEIFQIQYLLNAKVSFEPPIKKKEVVQCKRCQRYGHTKSYCYNAFRCVKCTQDHDTKVCNKPSTVPPTCVLCSGEHPANYKGCPVYKEIQNKQFPPLRKKSLGLNRENSGSQNHIDNNQSSHNSLVTEGVTFAQATSQGTPKNERDTGKDKSNQGVNETESLSTIIHKSFERFECILSKQAEQISTLLNLLTSLVSRLK